ncbi:MAG: hypothetical protein ABII12_09905 [Planctomycetota bacterium]
MAGTAQTEIDALAAPTRDRDVLIRPDPGGLPEIAESNVAMRDSYVFDLLGRPARHWLANARAGGPVIMTGHQPSFIHAGVWAKGAALAEFAERLGGVPEYLVVDTDEARDLTLQMPFVEHGFCKTNVATAPALPPVWAYEQLPALPDAQWEAFFGEVSWESAKDPTAPLSTFAEAFVKTETAGSETPDGSDYTSRWIAGMMAVDKLLAIQSPRFVRTSELFAGRIPEHGLPAAVFIAHLLLNAAEFFHAYNNALATYRRRRGIRGSHHPIPDLAADGEKTELPFWLTRDNQPRRRLALSPVGPEAIELWAEAESVCTLDRRTLATRPAESLARALGPWRLRPRALALTLYARLFLCDLFIHGIGGAKYDQITDDIIRGFFHVQPPEYVCVSATCRLPLPVHDVTEKDRDVCRRRLRDLKYNPQRYLTKDRVSESVDSVFGDRQEAIDDSERLRREEPRNSTARRVAFRRIREANRQILSLKPNLLEQARQGLVNVERQLAHNRVAASREWFFALHPLAALRSLRDAMSCAKSRGVLG